MLCFFPLKFATTLYFTGFPGISHLLTDVPTYKSLFVIYSVKLQPLCIFSGICTSSPRSSMPTITSASLRYSSGDLYLRFMTWYSFVFFKNGIACRDDISRVQSLAVWQPPMVWRAYIRQIRAFCSAPYPPEKKQRGHSFLCPLRTDW